MSFADQARAQILLQLRADGVGEGDKIAQELGRAKVAFDALHVRLDEGKIAGKEYVKEYRELGSAVNFWTKANQDFTAAQAQQTAAIGQSITHANAWGKAIQEGTARAAEQNREMKASAQELAEVSRAYAEMQKATRAWEQANERVNASLAKTAAEAEAAAERELKAQIQVADEESRAADRIIESNRKEAEAAAMLARQKAAALDAIDRRVAEHEAREGSVADMHRRSILAVNREQEHLNDVLAQGAQMENEEAAATGRAAAAHKAKTFEMEKEEGALTQYIDVTARVGSAASQSKTHVEHMAMGLLHISHAAQDAQYGFGAVVNNIPLVTTSLAQMFPVVGQVADKMGGPMGLAGAAMLVGVGLNLALPPLIEFGKSLMDIPDPADKATTALEKLELTVKKLEAKPMKFAVDYADLDNAQRKLDQLKHDQQAYDQLREAKTTTQEKVAKAVKEAIVEHAGSTDEAGGTANLAALVESSQQRAGTFGKGPETVAAREALAKLERERELKQAMADSGTLTGLPLARTLGEVENLKQEISAAKETIREESRKAIRSMITRASEGSAKALEQLTAAYDSAPDLFKTGGGVGRAVDPKFRGELALASPENVRAAKKLEEANRRSLDEVKEHADQAKKRVAQAQANEAAKDAARNTLINQYAGNFGQDKGLGGALGDETKKLIAEGATDQGQIKKTLMDSAKARLGAGGVPENLTDEVAATILNKVIDKVMSELTAAGPDIVANAKGAIEADKAKGEKPAVRQNVARLGGQLKDSLRLAILDRLKEHQDEPTIRAGLLGQVEDKAKLAGIDPEIIGDVAATILDAQIALARAEQAGRGGRPDQAAKALAGEQRAKLAAKGKQQGHAQGAANQPALAKKIGQEFQGGLSHEQANAGAAMFQQLTAKGENPALAMQKVSLKMNEFFRENLNVMAQMGGTMNNLAGMAEASLARMQAIQANIAMTEGRVGRMRTQRPFFPNTLPGN